MTKTEKKGIQRQHRRVWIVPLQKSRHQARTGEALTKAPPTPGLTRKRHNSFEGEGRVVKSASRTRATANFWVILLAGVESTAWVGDQGLLG